MIFENMVAFQNCCTSQAMAAKKLKLGTVIEKASK